MKYFLVLLIVVSMSANAIPILWTLEDSCSVPPPQPKAILCGSFVFDIDTGAYSDIDIWFGVYPTGPYHHHTSATDGDRFFLELFRDDGYAAIGFFDLAVPKPQLYSWTYGGQPITFTGGGTLTPAYSPPIPTPATIALICLALIVLGWARRKIWRHASSSKDMPLFEV